MTDSKTLLLRETGVARLPDGSEAVNVGPIVLALGFLTEGRGEDRGTDEHGTPLPDLLSLAFDVVQSIILGGRAAEYFRKVKLDFDAQSGLDGRASLALAKQAAIVRRTTPSTALERAATDLRSRLQHLEELSLEEAQRAELKQALQGFRDFGADRWVAATSHLLLALQALDGAAPKPARASRPRKVATTTAKIPTKTRKKPATKARATTQSAPKAQRARAKSKPVRSKPRKASKRR